MTTLTRIPSHAQLRVAPELAAFAVLAAALVTAEEALLAHRPDLGDLDGVLHGDRAPPSGSLVPVLVARFDELHHLLDCYHDAVRDALRAIDDDIPI